MKKLNAVLLMGLVVAGAGLLSGCTQGSGTGGQSRMQEDTSGTYPGTGATGDSMMQTPQQEEQTQQDVGPTGAETTDQQGY